MSYRDHLDFGIIGDREQVDDAWSLIDGARRALDELESLVGLDAEREAAPPEAATAGAAR
jgi:WS/DGAT C-terminal domain